MSTTETNTQQVPDAETEVCLCWLQVNGDPADWSPKTAANYRAAIAKCRAEAAQ